MGSTLPADVAAPPLDPSPIPACWVASLPRDGAPVLDVEGREEGSPLLSGPNSICTVVFEGSLYNRADLERDLEAAGAPLNDADVLALAYRRWGADFVRRVKGLFAMLVADAGSGRILAARDPLGAFPLFVAETPARVMFSTSIDALRRQPGVNRSINRAALADHLNRRWPTHHETFFAGIRRVPPGTLFEWKAGAVTTTRYWDPVPPGTPVPWVREAELQEQFDFYLEQAVARRMGHGPTGIFLSGGLDSISVAALGTGTARRDRVPRPIALSLGFPGEVSEEAEQRGVARALELDQEFLPFDEAVPRGQLLSQALGISRRRPAPLLNTWLPAYERLTARGTNRGVRAILSGAGGDEWLSVTPLLAADLLQSGNLVALARLVGVWRRSYRVSLPRALRSLLWKFGARPVASAWLDRIARRAWPENRAARGIRGIRAWVAPDKALREELEARVRQFLPPARPPRGFYFTDVERSLEHPLTSMELEEIFETGRALRVRFLHPYWDADLADLLYRTPPMLLFSGGRTKGLVRTSMARRFPGLGLERQKKRSGLSYFGRILCDEGPGLWAKYSDLTALADLGVVDRVAAARMAEDCRRSSSGRRATPAAGTRLTWMPVWELVNAENWARAHQ